jgi:ribonuclease D
LKLTEPQRRVFLVNDLPSLEQAARAIGAEPEIGLDAERASGFKYSNSAYLIQFSTKQEIFLLDPTLFTSIQLKGIIGATNSKLWILHSSTQDLPCLREIGFSPNAIYDTELAARMCGIERFGLSSLALELLHLEMAKDHSAADWSSRPLSDEMLNYAALDVDVLHELRLELDIRLDELGRRDWIEQEFERLLGFQPKPQPKEAWRNLPGITKVKDERRVRLAAALHQRRDEIARESDIAPSRLIPDRSIMAAVEQLPSTKRELANNKDFQGRASRSRLADWWRAIELSAELEVSEVEPEPNHLPNHRGWVKRYPQAFQRLVALRPTLSTQAQELGIAPEILLSPEILRRVCFEPEADVASQLKTLGARQWQVELVAPVISAELEKLGDQ